MKKLKFMLVFAIFLLLFIVACEEKRPEHVEKRSEQGVESSLKGALERQEIILATTTSTCNTGLLDALNKRFKEKYGIEVKTICIGTGKALRTGSLGDADLVLVHAPSKEIEYIKQECISENVCIDKGDFVNRRYVMYNYFVIVGPKDDPAGIKNAKNATEAFKLIAQAGEKGKAVFVSRGDESGTHIKEMSIWKNAGIVPKGKWYKSIGKGMADTLVTANNVRGYTLSDIGTYLAIKDNIPELTILYQGGKELFNPYHVMAVNPSKHPNVKYELAMLYIAFLTGLEGQKIIYDYGKDYLIDPNTKKVKPGIGMQLFHPTAVSEEVLRKLKFSYTPQ